MKRIVIVAGTRPNFVKVAPLLRAFKARQKELDLYAGLVHVGQHTDDAMTTAFFEDLDIRPDDTVQLEASGSIAQEAEIMVKFEKLLQRIRADMVIVVGDVRTTVACALTASKMKIPVAHVEAGLRSFDRTMPEEMNRLVTDAVSDYFFVTERSGVAHLKMESVPEERIFHVGNVMIDSLLRCKASACQQTFPWESILPSQYAVLTLHRPSNVDDYHTLTSHLEMIQEAQSLLPIIFPIHPRTAHELRERSRIGKLQRMPHVTILPPLGYLAFLKLLSGARMVLTDSGGIQEEAMILQVPCLTLRTTTERPVTTIQRGVNRIVGTDKANILQAMREELRDGPCQAVPPDLWDGHAAERIVETFASLLQDGGFTRR